jgi:hypothetical protein
MADTTVKYFHSAMTGAPVLSGTAGALIAALDACLKDGFALVTLDSLVVASNVATATRAAGHSMEVGTVVLIAGATPSGLNGEQKVIAVTSTTFQFATTGITNQTATGTITAKVAPCGWNKTYSGTNLAAYKPSDPTATGCMLRVDDTGTFNARVVGYEVMSDVNTGTGPFPTAAQQSGGLFWAKSNAASSAARSWVIFGDSRMFYFCSAYQVTAQMQCTTYAFGDPIALKSADAYCCLINGDSADQSSATPGVSTAEYGTSGTAASVGIFMPRSYTSLGASITCRRLYPNVTGTGPYSGAPANPLVYPNAPDGGLYVVPHYVSENSPVVLRSISPGFYCSIQNLGTSVFASKDTVTGVTGLTGKTMKAIVNGSGAGFFDTTGPWR